MISSLGRLVNINFETDEVLNKVTVEALLAKLTLEQQTVLTLLFGLDTPADWPTDKLDRWPPRLEDIGEYIGRKFRDGPVTEGTVRYIRDDSFATLRNVSIAEVRADRKSLKALENSEE